MLQHGGNQISKDQLQTLTPDQVAEWLCEVGYSDVVAKFLERDINGRKLLTIEEFEFAFLIRDVDKRRQLWNLLQDIIQNKKCNTKREGMNYNMFGRGGSRRPPERPRASIPGNTRYPPVIDQSRRLSQPPPQTRHFMNQHDAYPYDEDEFEDCSEDDVYEDENLVQYPPEQLQTAAHFRKSGAYPEFQAPPPLMDRGLVNPSHCTSGPQTSPRGKRQVVPNYTKWNPNNRKGNSPSGPVGMPGFRKSRPPIPTPDEGPACEDPSDDCYLTFDESAVSAAPPYPSHPPVIHRPNNNRKPEIPPPLQPRNPISPPASNDHGYPNNHQDDFLPGRPPPLPPSASPHGGWALPSPIAPSSRQGSGKDSHGSNSPFPSRESSLKDMPGHVPSRENNNSTGSDSSGDMGRQQPSPSFQAFAQFKKPESFLNSAKPVPSFTKSPMPLFKQEPKKPNFMEDLSKALSRNKITEKDTKESRPAFTSLGKQNPHHNKKLPPQLSSVPNTHRNISQPPRVPSLPPKPSDMRSHEEDFELLEHDEMYDDVSTNSSNGIESQAWFKDWNRHQSEHELKQHNQRGAFVVRPRKESNTKPYALTLWANNKCYNFLIRKRSDGEYALGTEKDNERTFATPLKLIEYYMEYEVVLAEGEGSVLLVGPPK